MTADKHELTCAYDGCPGRLDHLLADVSEVESLLRGVLVDLGIHGHLSAENIGDVRKAYMRLWRSAAL